MSGMPKWRKEQTMTDLKIISVSLPKDVADKLKECAKNDCRSVSSFVRVLIDNYADEHSRGPHGREVKHI